MWAAILRHYDVHHRQRVSQERRWFSSSASLEEAITRAALATDHRGKRSSHQRRIPKLALQESREALLANKEAIRNAADFDELLNVVASALRDVCRTGELYGYDTTLRISYYLDHLPTKVYLHAGTRTGARRLGLPRNNHCVEQDDLPAELRDRPAHEVEDILCIYKEQFR
jgi:hypothetical protein